MSVSFLLIITVLFLFLFTTLLFLLNLVLNKVVVLLTCVTTQLARRTVLVRMLGTRWGMMVLIDAMEQNGLTGVED